MIDLTAPRARRLARPGAVLSGEEAGVGPTYLLLHAGGERRRVWRPVIDVLIDAGCRCVAFDQRGHGESDGELRALAPYADDVAAMLDAEPPGCVVVGASLGGLAAMAAVGDPAVRARVAGLVLVDCVPDLDPHRVRRFLAEIRGLPANPEFTDDALAHVGSLRRAMAEFGRPVLLVRGGAGSPVIDDDVDRLSELAPQTTVAHIPEAGHLIAREQPVALAETIAAVTADWPALALLRDLGAGHIDHPGGKLLDHLQRVSWLVTTWGANRRVRLAALCHAAYGTDGFPHALLPLDQRTRLRSAIGDEAEALVYRYGACDRNKTYPRLGAPQVPLADRFTGETSTVSGPDLADFAILTIANELDVARTASLTPDTRRDIRTLISALETYAPEAAIPASADPALS
ncbi:alpha/beta fold hydrolase [Nocardia wallacei]|uniref:alpha/beta fold hydrolase n=1 Tax=Nocardia wallacei TaxID=480035 RepID=UPI00245608E6|nr:alpha/beta fold hydrolase [Nocardia wallacei]